MSASIFSLNIASLKTVNQALATMLEEAVSDSTYGAVVESRNGKCVPCFGDGIPANSRYDPLVEAERTIEGIGGDTFVLFLGITGGYHIRSFLEKFPGARCAVAETSISTLRSLLELVCLDDVLSRDTVHVLVDCQPKTLFEQLPLVYLPSLHGSFTTCAPRSWASRFFSDDVRNAVSGCIDSISRDYSVQAHFGRIWVSNFFRNMSLMKGRFMTEPPVLPDGTQAVIAAAGPSLGRVIPELCEQRERFTIFSTDTAYGTLVSSGIIPDFCVSIDPQQYSSLHYYPPLSDKTVVIVDCCVHPAVIKRVLEQGSRVLFAAGGHPLARHAVNYSPLPLLDTGSGTVTTAAREAAISLGFTSPRVVGADFAYLHGKPYAQGTYLSSLFCASSLRVSPAESRFVSLMFRTPVDRISEKSGITYTTALMRSYRESFSKPCPAVRWAEESFSAFPVEQYLSFLADSLRDVLQREVVDSAGFVAMLPLFAWYQRHHASLPGQIIRKKAIELALGMIAGYTDIS